MLLLGKNMEAKSIENISVENSRESSRIGFVVTKKVDKRATVRNRIRRRIKAILRAILLNHCNLYINHVDYVMIVLEDFSSISYDELFSSVRKLFGEFKVKYDRRIH
jgi:ribonuclease P protein component